MKLTRPDPRLTLSLALAAAALLGLSPAYAADPPKTADVLSMIHDANQKEIRMAKMAEKQSKARDVLALAKAVIKDHTEANKKVASMAKKEKIELPAATPVKEEEMSGMAKDAFDAHFAQMMLDDHKKTIGELTRVRESTTDTKLKELISELMPALQRHQDMAQKLVDKAKL